MEVSIKTDYLSPEPALSLDFTFRPSRPLHRCNVIISSRLWK